MSIVELATLGWHLVPWLNRKAPERKPLVSWGNGNPPSPETVADWNKKWPSCDWAIRLNNAVVIDLEMKNGLNGIADFERIVAENGGDLDSLLAGPRTQTYSGGRHLWFRVPDGVTLKCCHLMPSVEIKTGASTVHIPPSMGYSWLNVLACGVADLPELPGYLVDACLREVRNEREKPATHLQPVFEKGSRNRNMFLLASEWHKRTGAGEEELFALLPIWNKSRCGDNPLPACDLRAIAKSVAGQDVDNTLAYELAGDAVAAFANKVITVKEADAGEEEVDADDGSADTTAYAGGEYTATELPHNLLHPTPLIGAWVDFVDSCNPVSQPELTLLSVISTIGVLMGRRFKWNNSYANFYTLALAESTCGKDALIKGISRVLKETDNEHLLGNACIGSDAGLIEELSAKNEVLWPLDEVAFMIKSLANPQAPDYSRNICKLILTTYTGNDFSKKLKKEEYIIRKPHPNIFGVAQPALLWKSITMELVDSGFLGRFLIFNGRIAHKQKPGTKDIHTAPFPEIMTAFFSSLKTPANSILARASDHVMDENGAHIIPSGPGADELYTDYYNANGDYRAKIHKTDHAMWTVLGRNAEKLNKLAMVYAWSLDPVNPVVTVEAVKWGIEMLRYGDACVEWGVHNKLHAGEVDADNKEVLNMIIDAGANGISAREFIRRTPRLRDSRTKIIDDLIASNQICAEFPDHRTRGPKTKHYYAIQYKPKKGAQS
jgi:hypothetical protein